MANCSTDRWVEFDCLAKVSNARLDIAALGEQLSIVGVDLGIVRQQSERLFEVTMGKL